MAEFHSQVGAVALRTNAKINLFLEVKARRPDGYHEIETIFHSVSLADTLQAVRRSEEGIVVDMRTASGNEAALPDPEENIVTRALRAFARRAGGPVHLAVRIRKSIPLAGGLAGGSANAAGALVAANDLYGDALAGSALMEVAAEVGSDVPFCLRGGTALASGRGEQLTDLPGPDLHLVLGISRGALFTRDVYGKIRPGAIRGPAAKDVVAVLDDDDPSALAVLLRNDLEAAAFDLMPVLPRRKEALLRAGALGALLCGSGPTLFGVTRDEDHAREVASAVRDSFDRVEIVRSRPSGVEPAR